ncbi:MAG: hypothetical protein ACKVJE_21440 [Pseudomonadales bacterium]
MKNHATRVSSYDFSESKTGDIFIGQDFQTDLSDINVIMSSVDTVRQLYRCTLDQNWLSEFENKILIHRSTVQKVQLNGFDFILGSGGASRFQYRLQNNELGMIVFVKSGSVKGEFEGTHIKIECSPGMLLRYQVDVVQAWMDGVVSELTEGEFSYQGVAIHLAVDVQGWDVPKDFMQRLHCRSSKRVSYDGIESAEYTMAGVAATYGENETMTFGSVSSVQFSNYDKTKQMVVMDKADFFKSAWSGEFATPLCFSEYDPDKPVRRLEMRFHHSVINQFHEGLLKLDGEKASSMKSYQDVYQHLGALWRYSMNQFKFMHNENWFDPTWTKFTQDANFRQAHDDAKYKRVYKEPGRDNARNIGMMLGNMISIYARNKTKAHIAIKSLIKMPLWNEICGYLSDKGMTFEDFYRWFQDALLERRMRSKWG